MIRLILVDDHEIVRHAICELLSRSPDISVVADVSSGAEMLEKLRTVKADLLILDMPMSGLSGVELISCVKARYPALPILVLSAYQETATVSRAMKAGASGYVGKSCSPSFLFDAIRKTVSVGKFLSPELAQHLAFMNITTDDENIHAILSKREIQVFEKIISGTPLKQIAGELFISDKTVSTHKANLMEKLGVRSVPGLVKYAVQHNLVT